MREVSAITTSKQRTGGSSLNSRKLTNGGPAPMMVALVPRWTPATQNMTIFGINSLDFWGLRFTSEKVQRNWKLYHVSIPLETFFGIGWNWKTRLHLGFPFFGASPFCLQPLFSSWWIWKILVRIQNGNLPQVGVKMKIFETTSQQFSTVSINCGSHLISFCSGCKDPVCWNQIICFIYRPIPSMYGIFTYIWVILMECYGI